ncbi:hypothetical protein, partial [Citrobacter freundii]
MSPVTFFRVPIPAPDFAGAGKRYRFQSKTASKSYGRNNYVISLRDDDISLFYDEVNIFRKRPQTNEDSNAMVLMIHSLVY